MESMLRETLKNLCHKNGWSYAVFWKIKSGNRKILTWEEGYYEPAKPPDVSNLSTHLVLDSLLSGWDTGRNPLDRGVCSQNGCSVEDQIGLAVAQMSHQAHSLGEGIIGHVALTGKHQWVFREENCSSEGDSIGLQNSPSNFEFPAGWQNQFAAGIKTIAVIAVASYGVVQLGSTQTIMENLELVCNIKTLFSKPQHVPGAFLSGCIQENSFSSLPLFSHGNQSMTGTRNATLFHSLSNRPMPKNTSSGVLEQGYSSLYPLGVTKGLQSQARSLLSMCSSTGSSKPSSHFSQFQQNRMQLKCPTPTVTSVPRTEMGENRTPSGARVMYPFQGMTHTNTCTGDNHQALLIGSDTGSNQLALMEQQLVKEMGLRGQLHMFPGSSGQSTVQPKFQTNMFTGFQDVSALNSIFSRVESNNTGIALQSNLNASNKEEGVLRTALLEAGGCHPSALKQPDMQPSVPTFQDVAGHSENFVASSRSVVCTNPASGTNTNHASLDEVDISNTAYKFPAFSSANIQACGTDAKEPSCDSWGISAEQLDARLLKTLGNDLMPSLGNDLSVSEAVGVEQQSWEKEIITKDMSALFQDNTVDTLYPIKESSKASETGFGELLAITDDCSPHGFDGFDKYLKSLTKGQDSSSNAIPALPATNELFDALVPAFRSSQDQVIWDEILLPRGDGNNARGGTHSFELSTGSAVVSELDGTRSFDVSAHMGLEGTFFPECKSEHLLDAVVANIRRTVNKSADDTLSSKITFSRLSGTPSLYSPSVRADSCSTGPLSGCDQKQSEFVGLSQCLENADLRNLQNPAFTSEFQGERAAKKSSPNESPLKRHPSSWGEDGQSAKCENPGFAQVKKSDEPVKVNRKRARPGESARPRPKDRQQIQDRVKELREIVPNGTKCSIDALLERTIKHMLFLQSVTKHADKLKQSGESKVLDKDGSLIARDNVEGGASWALELGDQTMGCPIVVENLNQPRQMLVEMLCEERGLFLEIADIIRGLGLTILKGVMEARKDKIWAHFAVEANRDVHRVEILWSLMRLLQQNNKNSSSPTSQPSLVTPQGMDNGSQTFNVFQQPLIPTFGMAERLQ